MSAAVASVVVADLRAPGPALPEIDGPLLVAILGKDTPQPPGAVEVLVDPPVADVVLAAVDRALARHRLATFTESLQAPLHSLAEAVREAEKAYETHGASGARSHLDRIREALAKLEARVGALDED